MGLASGAIAVVVDTLPVAGPYLGFDVGGTGGNAAVLALLFGAGFTTGGGPGFVSDNWPCVMAFGGGPPGPGPGPGPGPPPPPPPPSP